MLVQRIQKDLFDFIEQDPDDLDGLIEYWYMSNSEALSAALSEKNGHNIIVNISSFEQFEILSKKLFLIADTLLLRDTRRWIKEESKFKAIPIPIKGFETVSYPPSKLNIPIECYKPGYYNEIEHKLKQLRPSPLTILHKPKLYWTRDTKKLNNGYEVAYAAWSYNSIPYEFKNWLVTSGKEYLKTGRIVYAPFIPSLEVELELLKNNISLPSYFNSTPFFHQNYEWLNELNLNTLLSIKLPFLENLDIETISKVKEDNLDDFSNFSSSMLSAIENVKSSFGSEGFLSEVSYIQRNLVDYNLNKIEKQVKRISNMSALRKSGVLMGFVGLNASMYCGAELSTLVSGLTGASLAFVLDKIEDMKSKKQLKDNDYYFLWKLRNSSL